MLPSLAWLHQEGRLHGAIRPSNLFLHADGRYRVGDGVGPALEPPEGAGASSAVLGYVPEDEEANARRPQ